VNPRDLKRRLARTLVALYHNAKAAELAEAEFDRIFIDKSLPDEVEEYRVSPHNGIRTIVGLMTESRLAASKSEARRLVDQGGVSIDGERVTDANAPLPDKNEFILKVGKRKFLKVVR
jgi:tyrosyl-tRNA synthetase